MSTFEKVLLDDFKNYIFFKACPPQLTATLNLLFFLEPLTISHHTRYYVDSKSSKVDFSVCSVNLVDVSEFVNL